jgi:DNA-directed RNA polymerase subunit RPC12/RpoP
MGSIISPADDKRKGQSLSLLLRLAEDVGMTLADCPRCGHRELRGLTALHTVHTDHGDLLALACRRCGATLAGGTSRLINPAPLAAVA